MKRVAVYSWISGYLVFFYAVMFAYRAPEIFRSWGKEWPRNDGPGNEMVLGALLVLILFFTAWIFYSLMYFFFYAPIRIVGEKIVLPKTNDEGIPNYIFWDRTVIDIAAIRKINKFSTHISGSSRLLSSSATLRRFSTSPNDKVVIIYEGSNVQLNTMFYGQDNINYLVESLWGCNDKIDIDDRGI